MREFRGCHHALVEGVLQESGNERQDNRVAQSRIPGATQVCFVRWFVMVRWDVETLDVTPAAVQKEVPVKQEMDLFEIGHLDGQHAALRLGDRQEHRPGNPQFAPLGCVLLAAQQRYRPVLFSFLAFRFSNESADRLGPVVGVAQTLQSMVLDRRLAPDECRRVVYTGVDRAAKGALARRRVIWST